MRGQRADHVVGLETGKFEDGKPHRFAHSPHIGQLHSEVVRHGRALRLVLVEQLVTEGRFLSVKHDGEIIGLMFLYQLAQHIGKQVRHFCGNARGAVEPPHRRKERAKDESHRVDKE